jgi:protocatechuate 3,4-dioxygenase beta subunit
MTENGNTSTAPVDAELTGSAQQDSGDPAGPGLSRRRLLQHAGALGLAAAAGGSIGAGRVLAAPATAGAASALALTPEQEEGPFYVAIEKIRKNISLGRPGVPLHLHVKVANTAGKPITGAACDIWHCDAKGVYSDESSQSTVGQIWLRGLQFTDAQGVAGFETIYPGHYQGRTTHIHIKVRLGGKAGGAKYSGGHVPHTGQLLFDDAISSQVYKLAPYTSDTAARVLNTADHVYTTQGGSRVLLELSRLGSGVASGYLGAINLIVNPTATPAGVGVGG